MPDLRYQTKRKASKEKTFFDLQQKTFLPILLFVRDYIPIMYIAAHLYVTTCDLYSCHKIWKAFTVSDEAVIWQLHDTQQKGLSYMTTISIKVTSTRYMKRNVCSIIAYVWHVPLID